MIHPVGQFNDYYMNSKGLRLQGQVHAKIFGAYNKSINSYKIVTRQL